MSGKILVVGPSWVGDMVMAQSLFQRLKAQNPKLFLSVLAPAWCEALLSRMPEVDAAVVMPVGHKQLQLGMRWQLARELNKQSFKQVIVLPGSLKSALIPFFAGIKKRTGFVGEQRYGLLNDIRKLDKQTLALNVERFLVLGSQDHTLPKVIPTPTLNVDIDAQTKARNAFGLIENKPMLALCPGAEFGPAKQWPATHFAALAQEKVKDGWQVILLGSQADGEICAQINALAKGGCNDLSGKTTLTQVMDVLSLADFVVSNDSGLMHIAAAYNRPLVAIYGSSSAEFTPPLSEKSQQVSLSLDCQPCFKRECPLGHTNCLQQLEPDRVLSLIS